jgi:hypothetical protein
MTARRSSLFISLALLVGLAALTPSAAHADGPPAKTAASEGRWEQLGERTVDAKLDKDVINVGREDGLFNAIQIKVEGSAMVMLDIKVVFGNGEVFEPKTRLVFNKDTASRVIDLPGTKRVIKRVEFKYVDLPGGGKAKVSLMGREAPPSWEQLGERTVDAKLDRDVINVGRDDGTFTAIQIKVEGSAMVMLDIKVVFGNGETFEPKTRLVFNKDTASRVIDLPGTRRVIKRVEFKYVDLPGGGKAKVSLMGRS